MKNKLVESFVSNASKSGAQSIVVDEAHGLQAALQKILDAENGIFCPELTALERSIVIPAPRKTTDVSSASAAVEEVAYGIAETGSIVCIASARKKLQTSLLPDHHIALLQAGSIYETFLDLVKILHELPENITLITGPSRTADIEKTLVLGMHGPRRVTVVVICNGDEIPTARLTRARKFMRDAGPAHVHDRS